MKKISVASIILYVIVYAMLIITLFPLVYIILASFKSAQDIMAGGINIFPKQFTFENYVNAWNAANFSGYTFNSVVYSGITTAITVLFSTMMGFCLNRKEFPGKKIILGSFLFSMFIAGAVTIYPVFLLLVKARLHRTLFGLIIATLGGSQILGTFLVNGYLQGIPKELDEAATIDGCGLFTLYARIILPVIKPVVGVVAMITFQGVWNNYMLPLALTVTNPKNRPLSVGVTTLAYAGDGKAAAQWDLLIAGSCMAIIPILVVYIFANKTFVSGLAAGAVKS